MKIKYLFTGVLISMLAFMSCEDPDDLARTGSENVTGLTITGCLASDESTTYSAIVDEASNTITIQVPYYISDTEKIQGDLTQMKVSASLPVGAKFSPSISGIRDLVSGFQSTLVKEDGSKITYTFKAAYVKSKLASISKVELTDYSRATIRIVEPESTGGTGKIIIYKTSSAIDAALKSAALTVSPWATIESSSLDPATGIIDLSNQPTITVIAQNGTDKTVYQTSLELPDLLPQGVGYTASLFGFQIYTDDTHGFEVGANRTMAVIDDYLIISNSTDYNKMIVMDRYNGKVLDVKVNTTGIDAGRSIHAITSDDAGHLVAMAYTSTLDANVTDPNVRAWVWPNGIENAPKSIVYANINGSTFANAPVGINGVKKLELGRTICVKGDLTSGDAIIATSTKNVPRAVFLMFKDGAMQGNAYVEWGGGASVSMWNATKVIPLTNTSPLGYIWASANFRQAINYTPIGTGARAIDFSLPTSHWWSGSATYDKNVRGIGYVEFNGTCLLGVQNGLSSNGVWSHRLYVSNITNNPGTSAMANGFIFDVEWGGGASVSMWNATKVIPLTNTSPLGYIWASANFRQAINYTPIGTGARAIDFSLPTSHWWSGSATYDKNVRGIGYVEFNGTCLLGVQNGLSSNGVWSHRLYVSNITNNPGTSAMANGFIFDSREGSTTGTGSIPGTGYAVTGMTSSASFVSGKQVLGTNVDETGDVVFGRSADGNAVQVYMLTTDQGLFAYEITRFNL